MDKDWLKDYPSAEHPTEEGLDENHSLRKMFYLIGDNERVVDFGCATGYFAQLLNKKGCIVTGVEINPDAAKVAEQYCKEVIVVDLDFVSVTEILPSQEFDVAVFGDVLEHLRNPWKILEETKQILKKDGYVVASIPNIAHGAIRLSLLQGRFEYTELGILDNTHLRFFTRKTVEELFERSGYLVSIPDRTKLEIFSDSFLIPQNKREQFNLDTIKQLEEDKDADTLQFIIRADPCTIERKYAAITDCSSKLLEEPQQLLPQLHLTQAELEQAQAQIAENQLQLQQLELDLQHTKTELERSQSQLQQTQTELEQSQSQLQQTQTELERSQSQLQQTQTELERSQSQLQQTQTDLEKIQYKLEQTRKEVTLLKSSITWKIKEKFKFLAFKALLRNTPKFVFYIDFPSNQEVVNSNFKIIGWCISADLVGIKAVRARIGSSKYEGIYGINRPDVAQAHSSIVDAEKSGFEVSIDLPPGEYRIFVEVVDNLDISYVITSHLVIVGYSDNQLTSNRLNSRKKIFKEVKEWVKFANLVRKQALEKKRQLGRLPSPEELPKIARWVNGLYQEQCSRNTSSLMLFSDFIIPQPQDAYEAWLAVNQWNKKASNHLNNRLKICQETLPKISVLMPVYNPQVCFLDIAIASTVNQVYQNWELCIADDYSTDPAVQATLNNWVAKDSRIRVIFREENGNISVATNSAATLATGDFILFLDHDDELTPDALGEVALYLAEHPETDFVYSDDDKIDTEGRRFAPQFKPDWSPELLLSYMYFSHLCVVRRSIFDQVGGLRVGFEGSQDYDFALRATEICRQVNHIPLVLYHWRAVLGSTALSGAEKPASFAAGQKALQEALERRGICGNVYQPEWAVKGQVGIFEHQFPDTGPSVAIIIPTKNQVELLKKCVLSLEKTTYQNYQIVIIDNESDDPQTIAYLESQPHQVLKIKNPSTGFSFAAINNRAVEQVNSDYILFLNNDTEVISPKWLSQLVGYAHFAGVGAVGAKLLYPDQRIQHAGVIHGLHNGLAGHAFKLLPNWNYGYLSYAKVVRNYSAVTAACLLTPRELFLDLGGFNEQEFAVAYNDVDYCYKLLEKQYRCVYCPTADLIHYEGTSRGFTDNPKERIAYRRKYSQKVDSFYNPHLSLENEQFRIQARRIVKGEVQPLKVLMCSNALNLTGAPNIQYEIAINLAAAGLIKPVVFSVSDGLLRQAYEESGIEVIICEHPLAKGHNIEEYERSLKKLEKEIERHQIDVIYANTLESFFMIDCAQKMNIPCVWNVHESEPWQTYFNRYGFKIAKRALECFSVPYKIIFGSHATSEQYLALNSRHNFTVIHTVLDLNRLADAASKWNRADARKYLSVNETEIVILLLGTVCERKGQQELVDALGALPNEWHNKIKCFIVGDRPSGYSNQLHAMVAALPQELKWRIILVPETLEVAKYYQAADIFVCTSRIECFPRVTLEAMAYGLPIVTTPVFGIKEQVQNTVNGIFYTPGSADELKNAILSLLENDALRKRLAENSRYVSDSLITLEEMVENYGKIFREAYFTNNC
ncbi:MAG TPA: glycosyltransferase [Nostoc sp.]|uniref:glycosyltransferase n=1 Tax=Nostoc sp. TaxID=1180 RepID=UPI002D51DBEB|nr:glycosyltransferase [Nostoc sp.]HYX18593.1 glycosyltransferase [Nostoc sp.]